MTKKDSFLRRVFELFTPGGTMYTDGGVRVRVSRNGTSTIEPEDMEKYLDSAQRKWSNPAAGEHGTKPDPN